ncbi:hypothetical protein [Serratia liquefaciens]|uniref:hypothetical protein n=1 Tax=Serratia liquefaciens TaxID=614 RepID=UPI003905F3B5
MNTRYRYHPLYLALLWACQATAASQVPPGFESLLLGQTERLEVRLPGRSLGLFVVEVKPDTLTFEEPETVLAAAGTPWQPGLQRQRDAGLRLCRHRQRGGHSG